MVADAVSRATHLPETELILHDRLTLAAEPAQPPYKALALTQLLVRRPGSISSRSSYKSEFPALSSPPSSGPSTAARADARSAWQFVPPRGSTDSSSKMVRGSHALQAAVSQMGPRPSSTVRVPQSLRPSVTPRVQPSVSQRRSPPARQGPTPRPAVPAALSSQSRRSSQPPSALSPLPEEMPTSPSLPELSGMELEATPLQEAGTNLQAQHDQHLTLDTVIDNFWGQLRRGYASDPAFASPPSEYRFDKHLQAYFVGHKLVIPDHESLRKQILMWHHVHPWHAHLGVNRTQKLIMETFHWPGISNDIKQFVSECHSCQVMKSPGKTDSVLSPLPVPTACWRVVSLDMITQLPRTASGFDCIVVFVDQFSKMVRLIPTTSTLDGPGFAKLFFQHIYPHYGLPLGICSDRGVQWNNQFFKSLCEHLGISLTLTFSYHPRANGQVERLNRVIEEALRHFVSPAHDDWDSFIPHVEFSMNSSHNQSTGCTPFQLNRITPPLSPTALAFQMPERPQKVHMSVLHRMYYHLAKQSLSESKQSMWSKYVKSELLSRFQVGKDVLLSISKLAIHHPSLRQKFTARWVGPCRILELVGTRAAKIKLPATLASLGIHDVFHFSCLKPFIDARYHEYTAEPEPTPDTDTNKVFEVEAVLDYRRTHVSQVESTTTGPLRGPHYLVRWKGYSAKHDLWLPVTELGNCLDKVAEYMFQNASASQREAMISQFPRGSRTKLTHLLQRAQSTRQRANTPPVMSVPPREKQRTRRQSQRLAKPDPPRQSAASVQRRCSRCSTCLV